MSSASWICASFNLSCASDMLLRMQKHPDTIPDEQIKTLAEKNSQELSNEEYAQLSDAAAKHYSNTALAVFKKYLFSNSSKPDFICFQEYNSFNSEKSGLIEGIRHSGYEIIEHSGVAIAVEKTRFQILKSENLATGALYVDVKDIQVNMVIRLVSDHLAGFNVKNQKENTAKLRENPTGENSVIKEQKQFAPKQGDDNLRDTIRQINNIQTNKLRSFVECFLASKDPLLIIYGLDANSTAKYLPKETRVHPKRLKNFADNGFTTDQTDTHHTIKDPNDGKPHKYDYIFAKSLTPRIHLSISSKAVEGDLDNPRVTFSDHLPVIAKITMSG